MLTPNKLVNKVIRLTIETGSLTGAFPSTLLILMILISFVLASVALITPILSAISSHPSSAALYITSNLYATTLMVSLNSRVKFKRTSMAWMDDQSELHDSHHRSSIRFNGTQGTSTGVPLATETSPEPEAQ